MKRSKIEDVIDTLNKHNFTYCLDDQLKTVTNILDFYKLTYDVEYRNQDYENHYFIMIKDDPSTMPYIGNIQMVREEKINELI